MGCERSECNKEPAADCARSDASGGHIMFRRQVKTKGFEHGERGFSSR